MAVICGHACLYASMHACMHVLVYVRAHVNTSYMCTYSAPRTIYTHECIIIARIVHACIYHVHVCQVSQNDTQIVCIVVVSVLSCYAIAQSYTY